ncbi:hypothetical protein C8F01DRAFT_1339305 [Mycena amicta]|nr:hypothetical protein C8F01DRAFT_1339305 [Mycena amicta]
MIRAEAHHLMRTMSSACWISNKFFPRLQKLRVDFPSVNGDDGDNPIVRVHLPVSSLLKLDKPVDYFVTLATNVRLPPSLTALFITWEPKYEHLGDTPGEDATEDQLVKLKDGLLKRCPALETVWIDGNTDGKTFTYRWEAGFEDDDGRFDEDLNQDDINLLREELYSSL